jgi:hypothetical protein
MGSSVQLLERQIVSMKRAQEVLATKIGPEASSAKVSPGGKRQSVQMRAALETQAAQLQSAHMSELEAMRTELAQKTEDLKGALHVALCAPQPLSFLFFAPRQLCSVHVCDIM